MVDGVKQLGLETCATLGMLTAAQAERLKSAGLDFYNHNLDTSPDYYGDIITTRSYQERLDTLSHVRAAGIHVCCGGIVGMGESEDDRAGLIAALAALEPHPESCRSTLWCASRERPWQRSRRSTRWTLSAPSRLHASRCHNPWYGSPPDGRR